ncbi:thioredoxin family protein [Falsibacillus albus]|uniref:Thioredoxin n=1 Tax=Falsibacillus albus TaxID=2478915 RepID=A0A3L7K0G4_9BACI|nr:thioredoxin family protein [Falsibacillus albus]RLQ96557.1 thioredoxin [Falsibacillus albus]
MEQWDDHKINEYIETSEDFFLYFYTPMCGTCQVAGKMLDVVETILHDQKIGKADLNYMPQFAEAFSIESVPCLVILKNGEVKKKIYAFHSVPYIYDELKKWQR